MSQRVTQASGYVEPRDALAQDWARWWTAVDRPVLPLLLPNHVGLATRLIEHFQPALLVLTGGNDVGQVPERDAAERAALELFRGKPVLGVCRGMQLMAGQSDWRTVPGSKGHSGTRHTLQWSASLDWMPDHLPLPETVNSYHDQVLELRDAPSTWQPLATHEDGTVEMMRHEEQPWFGIMWHPEREASPLPVDRALLGHLLECAP